MAKSITLTAPTVTTNTSYTITFTAISGDLKHPGAVTIQVTAPAALSLTCSPSQIYLAAGMTDSSVSCSSSNPAATVTATGTPSGVTVDLSNLSAVEFADSSSTPAHAGSYTVLFTATAGSQTATANLILNVIGNGSITYSFTADFSPAIQDFFINTILPVQYASCGHPLSDITVQVKPNIGTPAYTSSPATLYIPVPTAGDPSSYETFVYENSHVITSAMSVQYGIGSSSFTEGFAEVCQEITANRLTSSGINMPSKVYAFVAGNDALRQWDPVQITIDRRAPYYLGQLMFYLFTTTATPNGTLSADWENYSLSPFTDAVAQTVAVNSGQPLNTAQALSVFTTGLPAGTMIDGQAPATFFATFRDYPVFAAPSQPVTFLNLDILDPQLADMIVSVNQWTGTSIQQLAVPATLTAYNVSGAQAAQVQITTDENTMGNYFANNNLPNGAYTVTAQAIIEGTVYTAKNYFAVMPNQWTGVTGGNSSYPGIYVVAVDTNGNVSTSNFNVSGGSIVWQGPGVAVVACSPTNTAFASCTVNGVTISQPRPATRFVTVPKQ